MARNKVNLGIGSITTEKKKTGFTQIYNEAVQDGLGGLAEIGLLTYLMSLPSDWKITKSHLQNRFTRRTVDTAWGKLLEKQYALEFSFFADGYKGKLYFYTVSDEKYTQDDLNNAVKNVDKQLKENDIIMNPKTFTCNENFDIPAFISTAQIVQYNVDCIKGTPTNKELQRNIDKDKELTKIVNKEVPNSENQDLKESQNLEESKQELQGNGMQEVPVTNKQETTNDIKNDFINICNSFYLDFSLNHWTKKQWITLVNQYVTEIMETERYKEIKYRKNYVYASLQKITSHSELKNESDEEREERINSALQGLF